ncbi:hypothetical protein [Haloarcula argentinensis]|uniref:hypothetical protein n=1 Tax=Haloarcula argentinensis TaxID=43776 RepID=UPI0002B22844|nr:hypothetical protein [Haloarcula argentinensis]EMA25662.1 hypothetical protein C443_02594 [Haloarcula argentinensis DSM 12282]
MTELSIRQEASFHSFLTIASSLIGLAIMTYYLAHSQHWNAAITGGITALLSIIFHKKAKSYRRKLDPDLR